MPEKRLTYGQWKTEVEREGFSLITTESLQAYHRVIEAFGLLKQQLEEQGAENQRLRAALQETELKPLERTI